MRTMRTLLALVMLCAAAGAGLAATIAPARATEPIDWADLSLTSLKGEPVDGAAFKGRVVLLVNTASKCAFTPQYDGLEALWDEYGGLGLTVLGVPSNDFGQQEPGSNEEIAAFCEQTFGVSFPMLQKAPVTGSHAHPLFAWAREQGGRAAVPGWNFHKVLIGRDGRFVAAFPSFVEPEAQAVEEALERALGTPAL